MATKSTTKTTKTTAPKSSGLQYSDVVKAQGGSAVNRQTGAVTTAPGYTAPKVSRSSAGEYGFEGGSRAGNALPSPGDPAIAPTPTVNPIQVQPAEVEMTNLSPIQKPETATPGVITPKEAYEQAKTIGEAPQEIGIAKKAVSDALGSGTSFYKPSPTSDQVYDQAGNALTFEQYKAAGGKGVMGQPFPDVRPGLPPNTSGIEQTLAQDPDYQQLLQTKKEFNDVAFQRKSLTEEYSALSKKLGIDALNTELMNMKNVIEGSEDDLRAEVTKAGGFATESQIMALTNARNKQLIKNYNNLLEVKQQSMETLTTMIGLVAQDRQFALSAINQKLQIDTQIMQYKDKMKTNAQNQLNKIAELYGYSALQTGDPWQDALTERTLGLGQGGLSQLASMKSYQEQQLDISKENLKIQREQLNRTKYQAITNPVTGESLVFDPTTGTFKAGASPTSTNPANLPFFGLGPKLYDAGAAIANQFDGEQTVKNFSTLKQSKEFVDSLSNESNSAADDQGLVYAFAKAMDPASAVKEGEYETIGKNAQSVLERFGVKAKQFYSQSPFLTPEARENLKATINSQYQTSLNAYQNVYNEYARRIDSATGKPGVGQQFLTDYSKSYSASNMANKVVEYQGKLYQTDAQGNIDTNSPIGQNPLDLDKALKSGGLDFSTPGNGSASNQVKGMQQSAQKMQTLNYDPQAKSLASYASQRFPANTDGGQCGVFVRNIANSFGLDYPRLGDSLSSKVAAVQKYGTSLNNAGQGSVIVTRENPTYGHVAWIIGQNNQGYIVAESNFKQSNKISYGRVIPYNSNKIIGVINPSLA